MTDHSMHPSDSQTQPLTASEPTYPALPALVEHPEIVAHYKSAEAKLGLVAFIALFPAWGIWGTTVACWLLHAVFLGGLADYFDLFLLSLLYVSLGLVGIIGICVCLDDKLIFSADGITFPVRFITTLGRRTRKWRDLKQILFRMDWTQEAIKSQVADGDGLSRRPNIIQFQFVDGAKVALFINGMEERDLRELILTLDAYAPDTQYLPPRSEVELNIPNLSGAKTLSFTRLWEEDLGSRFASTTFVPMEPGTMLQGGTLTILGHMAFGGLSAIYLARTGQDRIVVLKEAVVPANTDEQSRQKAFEMFKREAQLLIALKHSRIAHVLDHFVEKGRNYLLLEHIEGLDLRRIVRDSGKQPEEFVIRWSMEIADILSYLHNQSPPIVHRDITPDNLVLARDGSITLIDFGAANEFVGTATGTLVGKQSYISPEQFRGKAQPSSDIYSLGCTMYFLLVGEDPEPLSVCQPRSVAPTVSSDLNQIVAKCTDQEVENRPADATALKTSLSELITKMKLAK